MSSRPEAERAALRNAWPKSIRAPGHHRLIEQAQALSVREDADVNFRLPWPLNAPQTWTRPRSPEAGLRRVSEARSKRRKPSAQQSAGAVKRLKSIRAEAGKLCDRAQSDLTDRAA